ncbi:MAG TPA: hypothetical protein VN515_01265 [Terriglobales bacterium]|nr:hypothetical protein [Terriglobales bacterium]
MVLALGIVAILIWLCLWGIFHLAGSAVHWLLVAGLALLLWRVIVGDQSTKT